MSGSAAQEVKFWEWAVIAEEGSQARQLTINNTRTLKMTDDVLCVRISPNGKYSAQPSQPMQLRCGKSQLSSCMRIMSQQDATCAEQSRAILCMHHA